MEINDQDKFRFRPSVISRFPIRFWDLSQIDKKYFFFNNSRNLNFGRVIKLSVKAKVRNELWHFHEFFGYLQVVLSVRLFKVQ